MLQIPQSGTAANQSGILTRLHTQYTQQHMGAVYLFREMNQPLIVCSVYPLKSTSNVSKYDNSKSSGEKTA